MATLAAASPCVCVCFLVLSFVQSLLFFSTLFASRVLRLFPFLGCLCCASHLDHLIHLQLFVPTVQVPALPAFVCFADFSVQTSTLGQSTQLLVIAYSQVLGSYVPIPGSSTSSVAELRLRFSRVKFWLAANASMSLSISRLLGSAGLIPLPPPLFGWRCRGRYHELLQQQQQQQLLRVSPNTVTQRLAVAVVVVRLLISCCAQCLECRSVRTGYDASSVHPVR